MALAVSKVACFAAMTDTLSPQQREVARTAALATGCSHWMRWSGRPTARLVPAVGSGGAFNVAIPRIFPRSCRGEAHSDLSAGVVNEPIAWGVPPYVIA